MINELEICVETCKDCYLHAWCSRHDQTKYDTYFQSFKLKVLEKFPMANILKNNPLPSYKKLTGKSSTGEGKYFDTKEEKIVFYPRFGSFEVTVNGVLIFSKIACSLWPNIECLCRLVSKTIDSLNKGINPSVLSLSYRLTNDRNESFISIDKIRFAKRPPLEKCNSSENVKNGKPRATNNSSVSKLPSNNDSSKINLKSKTLNLKKISNKFSCYGLKQENASREIKTILPASTSKATTKTILLAYQNADRKETVFTKSNLIVPKVQKYFGPKKLSKVKTQDSEDQTESINFEGKKILNKGKTFLKQANNKNNGSLNGEAEIKSASLIGHTCLAVEKPNNEADRLVKYPSFDTRVSEEKNLNENNIGENDGKNTNFSEQVSQEENLAVEIIQLKEDAKLLRSSSLHERLNKEEETSILIDEEDKQAQENQERPNISIPFSYLMPTKMHDWSASVSMEISELERKIGKSVIISSNEPTNILNKVEYASSCLKVEKSDANRLVIQNDGNICLEETRTKKGLFTKEDCSKANDAFFKEIEHVFKDNIPILGISKSYDSNLIEPQMQHRDIKIQSPKFHFSKNTFLSDVYSEPIESSYVKCEESDSHLFAEESCKQMQSEMFGKHEVQF